jgi:hypothetical protein
MTPTPTCPECGGQHLMTRGGITATGGYGPDLLPGTSRMLSWPTLRAVVCKDCGLLRYYVQPETLARVTEANGWRRA